jgi:hypothetical protein
VHGADGVHLLHLGNDDYQLVFGESKQYPSLTSGMREAVKSVIDFIDKKKDNFETALVNEQLFKEAVDDEAYELLKNILIPDTSAGINLDHSFGVFLGFECSPPQVGDKKDFRKAFHGAVMAMVESAIPIINKKVNQSEVSGYDFYVYAFPFMKLKSENTEIIKELTS